MSKATSVFGILNSRMDLERAVDDLKLAGLATTTFPHYFPTIMVPKILRMKKIPKRQKVQQQAQALVRFWVEH